MSEIRHLRALQAFDAAATQASLSRAADVLGVTHGAVSRQIKQLELYLQVPLLHRNPNGVTKTDAGEQLHHATTQAFSALRSGVRSVRRSAESRRITISLSASLAIKWLVPRLTAFRTQHPDLPVFLDTSDQIVELDDGEIDVALRYGVPGWGDSHWERLTDEDLIVVAAPSLVAGQPLPMAPADVVRLPLLHDEFNPAWTEWAGAAGISETDIPPTALKFADSAVLITAAIDGQGAALVRRLLVADALQAGHLVRLDNTSVELERGLYFVCRSSDRNRTEIVALRDWLQGQFKPEP